MRQTNVAGWKIHKQTVQRRFYVQIYNADSSVFPVRVKLKMEESESFRVKSSILERSLIK